MRRTLLELLLENIGPFDRLNFKVSEETINVIVGANGTGKSLMLKSLHLLCNVYNRVIEEAKQAKGKEEVCSNVADEVRRLIPDLFYIPPPDIFRIVRYGEGVGLMSLKLFDGQAQVTVLFRKDLGRVEVDYNLQVDVKKLREIRSIFYSHDLITLFNEEYVLHPGRESTRLDLCVSPLRTVIRKAEAERKLKEALKMFEKELTDFVEYVADAKVNIYMLKTDFSLVSEEGRIKIFGVTPEEWEIPLPLLGDGLSYVLFLKLLIYYHSFYDLVLLEEFESNLHPPLQYVCVRTLMLYLLKNLKKTIVLTTHSEHVLSSLLSLVRDGKLESEDLKIINLVYDAKKRASISEEIRVIEGELEKMPAGLFKIAYYDLMKSLMPKE